MTNHIPQIIIDTDPGQDDAAAILMAFGLENLGLAKVLGICAVAGNVPLARTQENARIVCDWAGREDVPVFAGASKPLLKELVTAEYVHGKSGLDGTELHMPRTPLQSQHASLWLAQTLSSAEPNSITICTIGPLTNIALALSILPECRRGIREIVTMGGAFFTGGNITPASEFNIFVDPHSAQIVLQSGVPIRIVPLDVTHQACITNPRMDILRQMSNQNGPRIADILQCYERYDIQQFGLEGGPLHDPCAIACAVHPEWFEQKQVYCQIDSSCGMSEGASIVDWYNKQQKNPNVSWCYKIHDNAFYELLFQAIATLP